MQNNHTDAGVPSEPSRKSTRTNESGNNSGLDLICFSHLRWHFVTQRPQHLLTRCAADRRVFFWEEPYWDADDNGNGTPTLEVMREADQLWVLRPHLPRAGDAEQMLRGLLTRFMADQHVKRFVRWYYTPMMLGLYGRPAGRSHCVRLHG